MSKASYEFKIYLFQINYSYLIGRRMCIFLTLVYVRDWFLSSEVIKTFYHAFLFMRQNYQYVEPEIIKEFSKKVSNHLVSSRNRGSILIWWQLRSRQIWLKLCWKKTKVTKRIRKKSTEKVHSAPKWFFLLYKHRIFVFCNSSYKTFLHEICRQHLSSTKDDTGYKSGIEKSIRQSLWMTFQNEVSNLFRITITLSQHKTRKLLPQTVKNIRLQLNPKLKCVCLIEVVFVIKQTNIS